RTETDTDARQVRIDQVEITRSTFSGVDAAKRAEGERLAKALFPKGPVVLSLDQLLADVARTKKETRAVAVKNDPPKIFVSEKPARLVVFDGDPVFSAIENTDLLMAVNTNWPLFMQSGTSKYYLLDGKTWLEAEDMKGPWSAASKLPDGFSKLSAD